MTVVFPNEKIAARWNGALQTRLKHAPLEAFLRSRGRPWNVSGAARVTDNLASATIHLVAEALDTWTEERGDPLSPAQHPAVGQIACAVSSSLALLIQEPTQWRTAALVATARLLERHIGLSAAAHVAAASAREFGTAAAGGTLEMEILQIVHAARQAVESNAEADAHRALRMMLQRLSSVTARIAAAQAIAAAPRYLVMHSTNP